MIKKDAVSARLNSDAGISYTEFSYQILQGMDFLELYRNYDCVLQTGGSDQWGNLTSGSDLIHKAEGASVHAIGTPLITNSDGTKFGKSEGNAIWLDSEHDEPVRVLPVLAQHRRRRCDRARSRSSRSCRASRSPLSRLLWPRRRLGVRRRRHSPTK